MATFYQGVGGDAASGGLDGLDVVRGASLRLHPTDSSVAINIPALTDEHGQAYPIEVKVLP
jgi:hypothetical protein